MANNLTSSGLYIGNGTLARVARIGSDSELIITKVNYSQSVSGSGIATAAGTVTLPSIDIGEASVAVYNNSSQPNNNGGTTTLYCNLPASGRYLVSDVITKESSDRGYGNFPSAPSVSGTLSLSSNILGLSSSISTSGGSRLLTIQNTFSGLPSITWTRQTSAILYGRIS